MMRLIILRAIKAMCVLWMDAIEAEDWPSGPGNECQEQVRRILNNLSELHQQAHTLEVSDLWREGER
jgi:hypothetical protein